MRGIHQISRQISVAGHQSLLTKSHVNIEEIEQLKEEMEDEQEEAF